jgi:hypothetical protein
MRGVNYENLLERFYIMSKQDDFKNGFLPSRVPGVKLPDVLSKYTDAINILPEYFSVNSEGVRAWLDTEFLTYEESMEKEISELSYDEKCEFLTVLSVLIQSYRWNKCPPSADEYSRNKIIFPVGLYSPWKYLSDYFSLPLSNTYFSVIASNWTMLDRSPGSDYEMGDIRPDNIKLLYSWLKSPYKEQLSHFALSFVELESYSMSIIDGIVKAFRSIFDDNVDGVKIALSEMDLTINSLSRSFNRRIKEKNISIEDWKEVVHIPFGWGLTFNGERLEGASGMQLGTLALLNSFFCIDSNSSVGKATLNSRMYMLPRQREFLMILDELSVLREFVIKAEDLELSCIYNKNINSLARWRTSHQKRGRKYLAYSSDGKPQMATGLTLDNKCENIDEIFYNDMGDRIMETKDAMVLK